MSSTRLRILLFGILLLALSACGANASVSPEPASDVSLTQVALQVDVLRSELDRIGPTLTAVAQAVAEQASPLPVGSATESPTLASQPVQTVKPSVALSTATGVSIQPNATAVPSATVTASVEQVSATPPLLPIATSIKSSLPQATPVPFVRGATLSIPSPTPFSPAENVLLDDDFSGQIGWFTEKNDRYTLKYEDGGYRMLIMTKNSPIWSVRSKVYDDVRLELDAVQLNGPADGYFGLVCRQKDAENYYLLVVSSDGAFGIGKVKNRELRYLNFTNQYTNFIKPSGNRLRADCVGADLRLFVDGQLVVTANDDEFTSGGAGLVAGNRTTPGTEVLFDNFLVLKP